MRAGRAIAATDDERGAPVAMVNEAFVRRYFGGRNPIGGRVSENGSEGPWRTVVGVVADVKHRGPAAEARPEVLIPYLQLDAGFLTAWARGNSFVVRTDMELASAASLVRQNLKSLDPMTPVIELKPVADLVSESVAEPRFRTFLLSSFALASVAEGDPVLRRGGDPGSSARRSAGRRSWPALQPAVAERYALNGVLATTFTPSMVPEATPVTVSTADLPMSPAASIAPVAAADAASPASSPTSLAV
jgi:hypothetical protein